jgi:TPR repeat protein
VSSAYSLDINSEIKAVSQNQTEAEKYYKLSLKAYENKDTIQAIELAKLSYGYGSVESAVILGEIFRKSNPSIRSLKESKKWYLLAANANNSEALMALGEMALLKQAGLTINDALIYLTKASDMGHTDAMVALSEIYLKGIGVDIDGQISLNFLHKASNGFNNEATKLLGDRFINIDAYKALKFYELAANAGHIEAAYITGIMYAEGLNILPNITKASSYLKQSADANYPAAQADYGLLIYQKKTKSAPDKGYSHWFKKAAYGGDKEGQFLYAFILAKGEGVQRNFQDSYYWLIKSGKSGNSSYDRDREKLKNRLESILTKEEKQKVRMLISQEDAINK